MFEEFLLQRMKLVTLSHALDGLDVPAFRLRPKHEAGANQAIIENDAAGAAVARAAAFLYPHKSQAISQHFEQCFVGVTEKLGTIAIDICRNCYACHQFCPAR
jgi:hypothetical protein